VKDNLLMLIDTARQREEAFDHDLFYGPPGLRKTTLAHVVDIEVGQAVTVTTDALSDITMEAVVTSISQSVVLHAKQ
jgi:Holliday junction DNA helicase RuvB